MSNAGSGASKRPAVEILRVACVETEAEIRVITAMLDRDAKLKP